MRQTLVQRWWVVLLLVLPGVVSATVAYVPVWREAAGGTSTWDGVHVYDVPSLQLLQVRRELPPSRGLAVSNDYTRLYLWDDDLHVYALPSLTHLRTWPAFNGAMLPVSVAVEHPLRPGTVIFGAYWWFDTVTGAWSTMPGGPYPLLSPMQISDNERWLTAQVDAGPRPLVYATIAALDLTGVIPPRELACAMRCAGIVAFGGSKLVSADGFGGLIMIRDFATGATERTFPPVGAGYEGRDLAIDASGAVLIAMTNITPLPSRVYRLDAADAEPVLVYEGSPFPSDLMLLGSQVLVTYDLGNRIEAFDLDSPATGSVAFPDVDIRSSGPWLAPDGPTPLAVPVPSADARGMLLLGLLVLVVGMSRFSTPHSSAWN